MVLAPVTPERSLLPSMLYSSIHAVFLIEGRRAAEAGIQRSAMRGHCTQTALALRGLPWTRGPVQLPPRCHFPGAPACSPLQTPSGQNLALWLVYSMHRCSPAVSKIYRLCDQGSAASFSRMRAAQGQACSSLQVNALFTKSFLP